MTQNSAPFEWTGTSRKAVKYLALGRFSDRRIAEKIGVSRASIARWKRHPEFMGEVDRLIDEFRQRVRRQGLAILERRVAALNDRWFRMQRVIIERSRDAEMQAVPGGKTGLLVHDVKSVGSGETAKVVDLYEFDAALVKEMREHEKQAAQELGQWTEKREITGDAEKPVVVSVLRGVSMSEI